MSFIGLAEGARIEVAPHHGQVVFCVAADARYLVPVPVPVSRAGISYPVRIHL
jgi:hypothetical protein